MALILIIIVVTAATATKKLSQNLANNNLGGAPPPARYSVGQTAKSGNFEFTLFSVQDPLTPPSEFERPTAGNHFVEVDVQVTNPGANQQAFSSVFGFHLLDSQNHQYGEDMIAGIQPGAPDGQIAGGQSVRGFVVFQIPDGTTGLRLRCQGGITSAGAVFNVG